jgi:predicted ATPase/DNA-binding SARP family transcriptional activator
MTAPNAPSASIPAGLPVHLTGFIGRGRELGDVTSLIQSVRLVTLTGAGGSGKTRLAAEAAARATAFTRLAWVDLASLADAGLVAQQIAATLQAPERAGATPQSALIDAIGDDCLLLVLDNCEHLVRECAELVDVLLRGCPRLSVLATRREALGVPGETAWLVPPMEQDEAQRLFVERAQSALPSFALTDANLGGVREICRRLDGIPLAIELAAARVRVLSPEQIATRLNDAFRLLGSGSRTALPRHRTLRATMEWSFNLLGAREQVLVRRLAVFSGTFDLDAVERVCSGDPLDVDDILDGMAALVDRSLVVMEAGDAETRYRLLETVRQYGRERLTDAREADALERRHAEHYLSVLETAAPLLVGGSNSMEHIERLAREHDNVRVALSWAVSDASRAEQAHRLVGSLFWFWYALGLFREARQFTDRALALAAEVPPIHRGRALMSSALTALAQGHYPLSISHFEAAIPLLREGADVFGTAAAMAKYGAAKLLGGDLHGAIPVLDDAIAMTQEWPPSNIASVFARFWRAWAAYRHDDCSRARALVEGIVSTSRTHNLVTSLAHALLTYARSELALGDVEGACRSILEGLELEVSIRDGWGVALGLDAAAFVAARRGRVEEAARLLGGTAAHRERLAVALPVLSPDEDDALDATLRRALRERFDGLYAEGRALSTEELVTMALAEAARHTSEHRVVLTPEPLRATSATVQQRLRVFALGPLQVFVGDRQIDAAAWGSARSRELLVYLLMHPDGRTKEQVGLAFWPDASAAQLRNSFHVTLHRLRKALGASEWVTLDGERYRVGAAQLEEFDATIFEGEVRNAFRALKRGDAGAPANLEGALARYRGDFLDGEPVGDWSLEHSDRLRKLYVDALMLLASRHETEERHAKAVEAYGRVLARDELHEEAVVGLMRSHVAMGERSMAMRLYQRFADRMRVELDADPCDETTRFMQQLQRGAAV